MGAGTGVEDRPHRGSLRAVCSGRHLSYLRGGWAAHGHLLRHILRAVSSAASAPCRVWAGVDSAYLVLRRPHGLAGLRHSRHRHAERGHYRLGGAASERPDQFPLCRSAYHSALGTTATLPGGLSTLLLRGVVHHPDASGAARVGPPHNRARPTAARGIAPTLAASVARAGAVSGRTFPHLPGGVDWCPAAGGLRSSHAAA